MNLIAITLVCNEDDILEEMLAANAHLYDVHYLLDCGSTDRSPAILADHASRNDAAIYLGCAGRYHMRQILRHVFRHFTGRHSHRDWWMIQDADEFPEVTLRDFVRTASREQADHIFGQQVNFYYTRQDYVRWQQGLLASHEAGQPVSIRRRHYRAHHCQVRGFRNLPLISWPRDTVVPPYLAKPASGVPVYRHYQYRDPVQIRKRLETRSDTARCSQLSAQNPHWLKTSIDEVLADENDPLINVADGNGWVIDPQCHGRPVARGRILPALKYGRALLHGAKDHLPQIQETRRFWQSTRIASTIGPA